MDLTDINQLFNYTEWANNLAMDAAAKLSDDNLRSDVGISHQSIFGTLLHMAGAEWIWLERWNGRSPAKAEAWSQWTTQSCADLAALRDRWTEVVDQRWKYVSELDDAKLAARGRSNTACSESRNDASWSSCRNDSPAGNRSTLN